MAKRVKLGSSKISLKENLQFVFKEAKEQYGVQLGQFDDIIKKNNSLILANTILLSLVLVNPYLFKSIVESNFIIIEIHIIGILILFGALFFSLLSADKSVLRIPKIDAIYKMSRKLSYLNVINAVTKEYIKDMEYNSNKFNQKSKILNISLQLLKIGLVVILLNLLMIIVYNVR